MRIGIVGGGITGLTAAYRLAGTGHEVHLFEREGKFGGLAHGFRERHWDWPLEFAYHHFFTSDRIIIELARELGIGSDILILRPQTATLWQDQPYQLDSPISLLRFPGLPMTDKIRTGTMLLGMKLFPFWQVLEHVSAEHVFRTLGGKTAWDVIWNPLLTGKFDRYARQIPASWLWARVVKRTPALGYFRGGFQHFVDTLSERARQNSAILECNQTISGIERRGKTFIFRIGRKQQEFDRVLLTTPSQIAVRLFPEFPASYREPLLSIPHLTAQILIIESEKPILESVYWLNVTDRSFPFLAVVGHTNFIDKSHYGGRHLTYIGNYLPSGHKLLSYGKDKIISLFLPYLNRLNGTFNRKSILASHYFLGPFAQPVPCLRYSRIAPRITTPIPGLFLANMDAIVPWDRGTNYAVDLGQRAATIISS